MTTRRSKLIPAAILGLLLVGSLWAPRWLPTAAGAEGGPTSVCDYSWTDSAFPDPTVPFSWIDIQSTGTRITAWASNSDDGWFGPLDLGFVLPFYQEDQTEVFVGTNGYLTFGAGYVEYNLPSIPDPAPPNHAIYGYGTDLNPREAVAPAGVYYEQLTAPDRFVVAYYDIPHYFNTDPVTFEVVLHATGEIWFQYLSLNGTVDVVGTENGDGTLASSYGTGVANNLAIRFRDNLQPAPVGVFISPCSQTLQTAPGETVRSPLTVTNLGTAGQDLFDLEVDVPVGWVATLYDVNGTTPLADTNGDGLPDTGPLAPNGGSLELELEIWVPAGENTSSLVNLTATSTADGFVSARQTVQVAVRPSLFAPGTQTPPVVDGNLSAGEWDDAHEVNLTAIEDNMVPGFLLIESDPSFLYLAYDAIGDNTTDPADVASFAFDTDLDGLTSDGREDQFIQGGWVANNQSHYVYDSSVGWVIHDTPYNESLPNHQGLASAWGFGSSDRNATDHRVYEFAIPLSLLGVDPWEGVGFFGGSGPAPGLFDASTGGLSLWPVWNSGPLPLDAYGVLVPTVRDVIGPTVTLTSPVGEAAQVADTVQLAWSGQDALSGLAYFEVRLDGSRVVALTASAARYLLTDLTEGAHEVTIRAYDRAGNFREASAQVVVDITDPLVTIDAPLPSAIVTSSSVTVVFNGTDAHSGVDGFEVALDGDDPVELPGTATNHTFTDVADGAHTLTVTVFDRVGHSHTATANFTVDTSLISPTGPAGPWLLVGIGVAGAAAAALALWWVWWRRRGPGERTD